MPAFRLMRELDRIAHEHSWTTNELGEKLGVNASLITHIRAGRALFSLKMLHTVRKLFPTPSIKEASDHYLDDELESYFASRIGIAPTPDRFAALDDGVLKALRAYVRNFARITVESGRGLFLVGENTSRLALAATFLVESLAAQGVTARRLIGNTNVTARDGHDALAAALLVVERADFASKTVIEILTRRAAAVKPIVLTSVAEPTALGDPYFRRIALAMTKIVHMTPATIPSPEPRAAA